MAGWLDAWDWAVCVPSAYATAFRPLRRVQKKPAEVFLPQVQFSQIVRVAELLSNYGVSGYGVNGGAVAAGAVADGVADGILGRSLFGLLTARSEANSGESHEHEN